MALSGFQSAFASARKEQGAGGTFEYKGKSYSTNYAEEMNKSVAKKQMQKSLTPESSSKPPSEGGSKPPGGESGGGGAGDIVSGIAAAAGGGGGLGAGDAVGGGAAGGAVDGALSAGLSSGFNPGVMAAGAAIGMIQGFQKDQETKAMGKVRADQALAQGEAAKADIYGQMAQSIRGSLGGAQRKRTVSL